MATDLRVHVETSELSANQVAARTRPIYDTMLRESPHFDGGNFATIHSSDLKRLFHQYDTSFFKAQIGATLGRTPLHFRLSTRMTRIEMLLWTTSSCLVRRFQSIALRFFGHTTHTHELITPAERAFAEFGIKPGDYVRFRFKGGDYTGLVNRVTKRATVLVQDTRGRRHRDGNRYATFYIPVESLEALRRAKQTGGDAR